MKIVIIDDSKIVKITARDFLETLGHEVFEADNGQKGLELVQKVMPDLIFLDYNMPVMDGPGFLKYYKVDANGVAPVIMMTTESSMEIMKEVISLGASEYIIKPFDLHVIREKIEQVMG